MNKSNKHFVIFGGAGYVGVFLVKHIQRKVPNSKITIVTRNVTKKIFFRENNVIVVNDINYLKGETLHLINLAYYLGTTFNETKKGNLDLFSAIEMVIETNTIKSIIHVSSIVLNDNRYPNLTIPKEKKQNIYYYAKSFAENKFKYLSEKYNINTVILRSGNIIGPGSIWVEIIANRLLKGKPLVGLKKEYPSNATFIGNLSFAITEFSLRELNQKLVITNFAELGNIYWLQIINSINSLLKKEIKEWPINYADEVNSGFMKDTKAALKDSYSAFLYTFYKGVKSKVFVTRLIDFLNLKDMDKKAKKTVKSIESQKEYYYDASEYNLISVFVSNNHYQLVNIPEEIELNLPYTYNYINDVVIKWIKDSGYSKI